MTDAWTGADIGSSTGPFVTTLAPFDTALVVLTPTAVAATAAHGGLLREGRGPRLRGQKQEN